MAICDCQLARSERCQLAIGNLINLQPAGCRTGGRASTGAASNTAGGCDRERICQQGECCPASGDTPLATSRYRHECRHTCLPAKLASHARLDANNASPRSDPDEPGKLGSDARRHHSTKSVTCPDRSTQKLKHLSPVASPTQRLCDPV